MRRVLIVDDHPIFAEAFAIALAGAEPSCVVDIVTTVAAAEARLRTARAYDYLFLDLLLPDADGFSGLILCKNQRPALPIEIISARQDSHVISIAHAFGAAGYLTKSLSLDAMTDQLRRVFSGEAVFPAAVTPVDDAEAGVRRRIERLSPAQFRVLRTLCSGALNKQIAETLELSEPTVKSHLAAIYKTLGVLNRSQAILAAHRLLQVKNAERDPNAPDADKDE